MAYASGRGARAAQLRFLSELWSQAHFGPHEPMPRDHIWAAAPEAGRKRPPPPFATQRFRLGDQGLVELAAWPDGPHPHGCVWNDEMEVWVILRCVISDIPKAVCPSRT
jgi:hypothetical protein